MHVSRIQMISYMEMTRTRAVSFTKVINSLPIGGTMRLMI